MIIVREKTNYLLIFGITISLFVILYLFGNTQIATNKPHIFSLLITIDFLIIIPFIYYLLIRKTSISVKTVLAVILIGMAVATFSLPSENQGALDLFKYFLLPVVELLILILVLFKVISSIIRLNKNERDADVFMSIKQATYEVMPKRIANLFATELAIFYYAFFSWQKKQLNEGEFTVHKDSGVMSFLFGLSLALSIEMIALHVLIAKHNTQVAWILSLLSLYTIIQVIGVIRSFPKRPTVIKDRALHLKYGMLAESTIPIDNIQEVLISMKDIAVDKQIKKFTMLNDFVGHNIILVTKEKQKKIGLYGFKSSFKTIAFHVDNPGKFKQNLEQHTHWNPIIEPQK